MNEITNDKVSKDLSQKLDSLTDRNWLFLSYIRKGIGIKEAYKLAGYTSKTSSAPYNLMHNLKAKAELITELEDFNRLKYMHQLSKLVSMPLSDTKKDVTLSEKLRILKLFKTSLPDMQEAPRAQFTQIVIKRYGTQEDELKEKAVEAKAVDAEVVEGEKDAN